MRPRRFILVVVAGALAIFGFGLLSVQFGWPAIVAATLSMQRGDGLSFAFERCRKGSSEIPDSAPTVTWVGSRTVQFSGIAESNCSTRWMVGDYSLAGDTITLHYRAILSHYALCDCKHHVTYRIEGLPRKNYRVHLRAQPAISPVPLMQSPWMLFGLGAVILSLASAGAMLVLRQRREGSALSSAQPAVGPARLELAFVCLLLAFAATVSAVFWYQAISAKHDALISGMMVESLGRDDGQAEADRDFVAGTPRWYRFRYSGDIPEDKADRKVKTVDGGGFAAQYRANRAFVGAYNRRMDDLVETKRRGPAKKRGKRR